MRLTDLSPRNASPAGINAGFLTAATSQISALFIPLDFMASRSRVIAVVDIFPFSQHQKAPGWYEDGGFTKSSFETEQLTIARISAKRPHRASRKRELNISPLGTLFIG
jgi:hypothetical protein